MTGVSNSPISRLQRWHNQSIAARQEQVAVDASLFMQTLEQFNQSFERVAALDGAQATRPNFVADRNPLPGEVDVPGIGNLTKTAEGFVLQVFTNLAGPMYGMGYTFMAPPQRIDKFSIDTTGGTITHEVYREPAHNGLGRFLRQHGTTPQAPGENATLQKRTVINTLTGGLESHYELPEERTTWLIPDYTKAADANRR